ncbi:MAG: hypothetical protein HY231_00700 [Acidobacteria bacterium]|nr:hypothetical protein [Acidobacteriota bacterium]
MANIKDEKAARGQGEERLSRNFREGYQDIVLFIAMAYNILGLFTEVTGESKEPFRRPVRRRDDETFPSLHQSTT